MRRIEIAHVGPQKSGTTWLYRALCEHPDVACPPKDSTHFFDMRYHEGREALVALYAGAGPGQKWFDPTPSYLRSPWVPRRLAAENPEMRVALCLRNPLERAFSHYWHEKKKQRFDFSFDEVLVNYDLYSSWLEPGFYAEHIERYLERFPREQLLWQRFERIADDPEGFFAEFCRFAGIRDDVRPATLHRKVNAAGERHDFVSQRVAPKLKGALRRLRAVPGLGGLAADEALLSGKSEYVRGVPPDVAARVWEACEPEVQRLEALTGLDLAGWRPAAWRSAAG